MTKRTIKTITNSIIDTIENSDIECVKKFGGSYVFGTISSLCNIADNPQGALEQIVRIASVALTEIKLRKAEGV